MVMPRRVAIVGTGLIGGSIGLAARRGAVEVVGYDSDTASLEAALQRGAVDDAAESVEDAVGDADLVVLATPVDVTPIVCDRLADVVPAEAAVTDVGSAKEAVVDRGVAAFGPRFVGGHPMAGSERHGIAAAAADLFEGAWWILTPTEEVSHAAYSAVSDLVFSLGARPVALAPSTHDALVARLSHVPQLAASALVDSAAAAGTKEALLGLAGAGFRDVTRIAASDPALWVAIVRANARSVLEGLAGLDSAIADITAMVEEQRWDDLHDFMARARAARLELFAKPTYTGEPVSLTMMIPDRPGVLAEVTTVAGNLGANIEDLRIIHSTEGGRGRLELVIAGEDAAAAVAEALRSRGFRVDRPLVD
ncbi:MAG: prephenate dehydrogenase [Actinobacteria bacterium]|nr:prephenate dehydrogenase [Actinomycetota bacterium]